LVRGQIGGGQFQVQEVLAAGEVQRRGRGRGGLALLQQVGDVITTVRLKSEGVVNGAGHGGRAVEFAQGNDFLDVVGGGEALFLQLAIAWFAMGFAVNADIGHLAQPLVGGGAQCRSFFIWVRRHCTH